MEKLPQKKYFYYWDNLKGFFIILVVFAHMIIPYVNNSKVDADYLDNIYMVIETFTMPVFIFCAGYLSKSPNARNGVAFTKLLLIYVIFNGSLGLFDYFLKGDDFQLTTAYTTFWYLLSLILWRFIADYLSNIKWCLVWTIAFAMLSGFWADINDEFSLRRTIGFLPFFMLGYILDKEKMEKFIENKKRIIFGIIGVIIMIGAVYYLVSVHPFTKYDLFYYSYRKHPISDEIIDRGILIGLGFAFIAVFSAAIPNCKIPLITQWGKNSLGIFVLHKFFQETFTHFFPAKEYTDNTFIIVIVVTLLICLVLGLDIVSKGIKILIDKVTNFIFSIGGENQNKLCTMIIPVIIIFILLAKVFEIAMD